MRERHDAGGNRSRRATAGAARRMVEIPWVAARAEQFGLRIRHLAEFGRAGLGEDIETGGFRERDHGRVLRRNEMAIVAAAHRHAQTGDRRAQILDQIGHAGQR
jgi:hypothetical protein